MNTEQDFYICPVCFHASDTDTGCHGHKMLHYTGLPTGHEQLRPSVDGSGHVKTRMPQWLQALQKASASLAPAAPQAIQGNQTPIYSFSY